MGCKTVVQHAVTAQLINLQQQVQFATRDSLTLQSLCNTADHGRFRHPAHKRTCFVPSPPSACVVVIVVCCCCVPYSYMDPYREGRKEVRDLAGTDGRLYLRGAKGEGGFT